MLSFVHAADLHLGSPFAGIGTVDEDVAARLRHATVQAFENLVDLCLARRVDFLLVAGDVYDSANRTLAAQLAFLDGLRRLAAAGIYSYVAHGNHDPLDGWASSLAWPERVHIFGGAVVESVVYERDGAAKAIIHGISHAHGGVRANLARDFRRHEAPVFQIGLLHCNLGDTGHQPYAPCSLADLSQANLDYWALGHVHTRGVFSTACPVVAYPGNLQGRHVNEAGPRGCFLVQVNDDKAVHVEFVALDAVRWSCVQVAIDDLGTEEELVCALEEALGRVQEVAEGRPSVCRLAVVGRGPLHRALIRRGYADDLLARARTKGSALSPPVWTDALEVRTRPPVDLEALRRQEDAVGDCLRLIEEYRGDEARREVLRGCLAELFDDPRARRHLPLADDDLLALLAEAETLCLDLLLKEDGQG